jgi:chromosome partitioning protein
VINQFNSQARLPGELVAELEAEGYPVLPFFLGTSVKMKESHYQQRPLVDLAPSHKLTQQYLALHGHIDGARKRR